MEQAEGVETHMRIASAQQMRQLDQAAIRERGIPSDQLMERAAAALAIDAGSEVQLPDPR